MGLREVSVVEIREVLRAWMDGAGLRIGAERASVDRITARRYVTAAQQVGFGRPTASTAVSAELIDFVITQVRPDWPTGAGSARGSLEPKGQKSTG